MLISLRTNKPGSPSFSSFGVQQVLEESKQDVLLLYDCCHSSHSAVNPAGRGVTEVIAACGFETQAPAVGPHSFTSTLIKQLEESFSGPPIYVAELHGNILGSLKNWQPDLLRDSTGNVWKDQNGYPRRESMKRRTPVHCLLTTERPGRSIMLAPLPFALSQQPAPKTELSERSPTLTHGKTNTVSPDGNVKARPRTHHSVRPEPLAQNIRTPPRSPTLGSTSSTMHQYPAVLISVRLEEDYFMEGDEDDENKRRPWLEWFRNIPGAAQGVTIQSAYRSFSTLLVISMPIALWNLLPADPAYSFIGFVNSNNLVTTRIATGDRLKVAEVPGVASQTGNKWSSKHVHGMKPLSRNAPEEGEVEEWAENQHVFDPNLPVAEPSHIKVAKRKPEKPIKFTDSRGRKFTFPFEMCRKWEVSLIITMSQFLS